MKVAAVAEMRALDRRAGAEHGLPEAILMENAGLAAVAALRAAFGPPAGRRIAVLCGPGNNGGDGMVVARQLHATGAAVEALLLADPARYRRAAAANLEALLRCGAQVVPQPSPRRLSAALGRANVAVDGLLGTGVARAVEGTLARAIDALNRSGRPILALDIPSGVDGDTGQIRGAAVAATWTVTFGLPKRGNLLYPGAGLGGRLFVSPICFPPGLRAAPQIAAAVSEPPPLPPRALGGHKGSFGDVLVVAGAGGYYGAPAFSALAHLKAGGGYARLAAPRSVCAVVAAGGTELVLLPQPETAGGSLGPASAEPLLAVAERADLVVVGPGLSLAEEAQSLVRRLAAEIRAPLLVDGDGLTALAGQPRLLARRPGPTILTPHLAEAARLAGSSPAAIAADPIAAAQRLAAETGAIVVLKGAHSLIARPGGQVAINLTGNSGMASAGCGDVLNGAITALAGLGLPLADAAEAGVLVHGLAGDIAAAAKGEDGITARDVLEALPLAVAAYRERHAEVVTAFAGRLDVIG